jgi:hypothetical protein
MGTECSHSVSLELINTFNATTTTTAQANWRHLVAREDGVIMLEDINTSAVRTWF